MFARVHLHGRRQVEDDPVVGVGLDDVHDRRADLDDVVDLGAGEALGRVLVAHLRAGHRLLELAGQAGGVGGDLGDAVVVEAEDHPALQDRGRVVEVDDRLAGALDRLVGALDQLGAALGEDLDGDVVGYPVLLHQLADEVEVGLAGAREADLDLLEAHLDQGVEHGQLAGRVHRVDQGLVAVAQVDRAPQRRLLDALVGPAAVVELEGKRKERPVLVERHLLRGDRFRRHGCSFAVGWVCLEN